MAPPYRPYVPQTLSDLIDKLSMIMLSSPTFIDKTGYFPERNVDTVFFALNAGLSGTRAQLGEELYRTLIKMSHQARAYFEADPEDTGEAQKGRELIFGMIELIKSRRAKP
jgi:hypothetical protein